MLPPKVNLLAAVGDPLINKLKAGATGSRPSPCWSAAPAAAVPNFRHGRRQGDVAKIDAAADGGTGICGWETGVEKWYIR